MSLKGKAEGCFEVKGRLTALDYLLMTAYGVALKNGFEGTEQEWLDSLVGPAPSQEAILAALAEYFKDNPAGILYTPHVDANGNLSWTNNAGKANPAPVNIKGPKGNPGSDAEVTKANIRKALGYTPANAGNVVAYDEFAAAMAEMEGRINEVGGAVGDTLTTARTDLDDTWLLCNGDQVSAQDYGELAKLFPSLPTDWVTKDVYGGNSKESYIKGITYANGYWVAVGQYYDGSTYHARIAYTTDPTGTWTTKDLWSSTYNGYAAECVTYANGYWVVGGVYSSYARIAYATDLAGTWTTKDLWSGSFNTVFCIAYANGYWVVGGRYGSNTYYARIAYATDLAGTWTTKDLWSGSIAGNIYIDCITYADGYWVAGGRYRENNSTVSYARIAYTTDLAGTWTTKDLSHSGKSTTVRCITYANGYWVAGGSDDDGTYFARIWYTTDLAGTWTTKDLWSYKYSSAAENPVTGIINTGKYWVVCGVYNDGTNHTKIAYTTDITGEWTIEDLWSDGSKNDFVYCITCADDCYVVGGVYCDGTNYYARIAYSDPDIFVLPTISGKDTYTYIKAKEE